MPNQSTTRFYDDRREVSFLVTAAVFWAAVGLLLVARDPFWRMFYEGQVMPTPRTQNHAGTALDEQLISRLTKVDVSPRPGLRDLENEFAAALGQRAAQEAAQQGGTAAPQLAVDERLREMARGPPP
ncbi:MAG TPA: hypothetical protein VGV38_04285, partial [Pyrinomonadaceae bacterium]|nr:hypothetical protein [Pyrinomonadaceae bacterium]